MLYECGDVRMDEDHHRVTVCGEYVKLTNTEYAVLRELLMLNGKTATAWQLTNMVWGIDPVEFGTIKVHVHNLRKKIGRNRIVSVYGRGYAISTAKTDNYAESFDIPCIRLRLSQEC